MLVKLLATGNCKEISGSMIGASRGTTCWLMHLSVDIVVGGAMVLLLSLVGRRKFVQHMTSLVMLVGVLAIFLKLKHVGRELSR